METKLWDWDNNGEDTGTQDTFWASFVVDEVDNENPIPVNIENNDNMYPIPDPIPDPESPTTPPTYAYEPNSESEREATISSSESSLGSSERYDHRPVRGLKDITEIYQHAQQVETSSLFFTE